MPSYYVLAVLARVLDELCVRCSSYNGSENLVLYFQIEVTQVPLEHYVSTKYNLVQPWLSRIP